MLRGVGVYILRAFRDNISVPSSRAKQSILGLDDPWVCDKHAVPKRRRSPTTAAQHARRVKTWKPKISKHAHIYVPVVDATEQPTQLPGIFYHPNTTILSTVRKHLQWELQSVDRVTRDGPAASKRPATDTRRKQGNSVVCTHNCACACACVSGDSYLYHHICWPRE